VNPPGETNATKRPGESWHNDKKFNEISLCGERKKRSQLSGRMDWDLPKRRETRRKKKRQVTKPRQGKRHLMRSITRLRKRKGRIERRKGKECSGSSRGGGKTRTNYKKEKQKTKAPLKTASLFIIAKNLNSTKRKNA